MTLEQRIDAFSKLGDFLTQFHPSGLKINKDLPTNELFLEPFRIQVKRAFERNGWFTDQNVNSAFNEWGNLLNSKDLNHWSSSYNLKSGSEKSIGVIMAGNIPLVGFHDFLTVLISGHSIRIKQSSSDAFFLPLIARLLQYVEPGFKDKIFFSEERLSDFDAVIATGSNNTARHFEYYFGNYPHLIRRNRNSVAVLTGKESEEDLDGLGEDIFRYFGLGCRSVSKLMVPRNYDFDQLFGALYRFKDLIDYEKYRNNYDYNKAVYLMSRFELLENGFVMLKEDSSYASPIATLFYEYYDDEDSLSNKLEADAELIQCIVGKGHDMDYVPFGRTQKPQLNDYADGVDTLDFLAKL
ncbi:MAG: acyl-CoA reductase [Lutimonas sp.]